MIFTCLRFCKENLVIFFRSAIYCKPGVFKFFSSAWCVFLVPHLIENKWSSWNIGRTSISASSNSPIIASQVVANLTYKDTAHFCCSFLLQFVGMLFYHHLKNLMFTIHLYRPSAPHGRNPPLTNLLIKSGSPQPVLSIVVRQTVLPESIIWGYTILFYTQNTYSYLFIWHASSSTSMTWQNIFVCQSLCQRSHWKIWTH